MAPEPARPVPAGPAPVNPPPPAAATAVFVLREVVALLFVAVWLLLFAASLFTGAFELPFWFHCTGVAVMAYALGMNAAELGVFRALTAGRPGSG